MEQGYTLIAGQQEKLLPTDLENPLLSNKARPHMDANRLFIFKWRKHDLEMKIKEFIDFMTQEACLLKK